ncbi:FUSC family protein [Klebsiella pneumoniae]|nr:FUSC family protein [Klebsiella pneumoniae]
MHIYPDNRLRQHGYWILLTNLFVCQPNYNATRHRLALRIVGTLVGVAIGLPVLSTLFVAIRREGS